MPRPYFICNPNSFYHVTNRSINKDWFQMEMSDVWSIMENELYFVKHAYNLEVYAFVLMNNHFHLLVRAPNTNLSEAISFFLSQSGRQIVKAQGRINHIWAHRFKRCEMKEYNYFVNTYKYIYQNPLRAKICETVQDYPYSTLFGILGQRKLVIPIEEDTLFFEEDESKYFEWINKLPNEKEIDFMRKALRRTVFSYPKIYGKLNYLENIKI